MSQLLELDELKINEYMELAFEQAEEAYSNKEVPVGCIYVNKYSGEVVSRGRNETNITLNGTRHAEIVAYDKLYNSTLQENQDLPEKVRMKDCILFVTVEPCIMCAAALRFLEVSKVYYGCGNERFGGCGSVLDLCSEKLCDQGLNSYEAVGGIMREEAILLLRRFYVQENDNAPEPKKKTARVLKLDVPEDK